jgi:hypothetical protein
MLSQVQLERGIGEFAILVREVRVPTVRLDGDEMAADADDGDARHAFETLKSRR